MPKLTPFLWYNDQAEEAAEFYTKIFKKSKIHSTSRFGENGPGPKGKVNSVTFELNGQNFIALNGGPQFSFTPAISIFVECDTQEEVDELWEKLTEGGAEQPCGWLKDKFGLSWQIIPKGLIDFLYSKDDVKSARAMNALLQMKKIDIAAIRQAYEGG
jgi:predicted 3-demethylubiquinone-9 3-methyltransferase (glyoxalase superfamily)